MTNKEIYDGRRAEMGDKDQETKEERLEKALLEFIEREAKEPSSGSAVSALPMMAQVLINLWNR